MVFIFTSIELINKENKLSINIDSFIKDTGILLTYFEDGGLKGEFSKIKGMNQHGQSINSTSLSERLINLEGIILADSMKQIEAFKNLLVRILNPLQDVILKYNENSTTKEIVVRAEETPAFSTDYKTNNENGLAFKCDLNGYNPFWQDLKEHETTLVTWIPNLEFPAQESEGIELFHTEQKPNYWLETTTGKGKNLFDKSKVAKGRLYATIGDDFKVNTTSTGYCTSELIKIKENMDLRISGNVNWIVLYSTDKKVVRLVEKANFTKSQIGECYIGFYSLADDYNLNDVQLEEGTTATAYEEYKEDKLDFIEFQSEFGEGIRQEWGYREIRQIIEVNNIGDVECPLKVMFRANGDVEKPYIQDIETYELIRINRTLKSGDVLEITTGYGNKNVYLNGKKAHQYLDFLNSTWLQLKPGVNLIKYGAEKGLNNLECTVFYTPLYLGV
ncbi:MULTISPECIES: phage distal tail protein [Clostridium]|uniref:phage distal tail protein n=1 Tax=Clostridium TaxID=1485 RepID=UPI000772EC81|nr:MULTISPECIES: phage tail domain-containing protein [Clostridium]AUM96144.1 hypothetical protein RSJ11_13685 [Clostridium sporogenes]AVQ53595.1 hypothetical protein C7M59_12300 [Clostridium botulinum]